MSFFNRLTNEQLKKDGYTHQGFVFGWVPVYLSIPDGGYLPDDVTPVIATRNWVPDWTVWLGLQIWLWTPQKPGQAGIPVLIEKRL